jgi:hypothetical protein
MISALILLCIASRTEVLKLDSIKLHAILFSLVFLLYGLACHSCWPHIFLFYFQVVNINLEILVTFISNVYTVYEPRLYSWKYCFSRILNY